jgi:chromosome segregation ATPase
MSDEPFTHEPTKNRLPLILGYVGVAVVMFGAGMLMESHLAAKTASEEKVAHEREMKQAADKAEEQKRALADALAKERDTLAKEQEENAKAIKAKDKSLAAASNRAAGVQHALETDLSAARTSGEACTSRINGISEALGGVFDSVREVTGIAQDLGRENEQLKTDNKSLADKLAGWQKWNAERLQRVTVTGQKSG